MDDNDQIPPDDFDNQGMPQDGQEQQEGQQGPDIQGIKSKIDSARDTLDTVKKLTKGKSPLGNVGTTAGETGAQLGAGVLPEAGTMAVGAGTLPVATAVPAAATAVPVVAGGTAAAAGTAPVWIWPVAIGAIILILIILFMVIISAIDEDNEDEYPEANIIKTGPEFVPYPVGLQYTINVSYTEEAEDIIVTENIPQYTYYVRSEPKGKTFDASGNETSDPASTKKIEWSLREIQGGTPPSLFIPQSITLILHSTQNNIVVNNNDYSAQVIPPSGDGGLPPPDDGLPPNTDDCGGYYAYWMSINPYHTNYGDPQCTMLANLNPADKSKLYDYIKKLDRDDAYVWWDFIIPRESYFSPNAINLHAKDSCGAWGLFQMNKKSCVPPQTDPFVETFWKYRFGDINWEVQAENAINYGNNYRIWFESKYGTCPNAKWRYWEAAKHLWPCGEPF